MENKNNETKTSLIARLFARYHNSKVAKSIVGLTVATAVATSMVACDIDKYFPPRPDHSHTEQTQQTDPNETTTQNGTTNTVDSENNTENPTETENQQPDLSEYSELLQYVLTDSYYTSVISKFASGAINKDSAYFDPHPYAFLEDEGFDVNAIRTGHLKCSSRAFVKENEPNTLYMYTMVETKASTPYFTEYMLKYELTEKEMTDYNMMHDNNYLQAAFMNDAVSELKTPTIISQAKCAVDSHESILTHIKDKTALTNIFSNRNATQLVMINFSEQTHEMKAYVFSTGITTGYHKFAEIVFDVRTFLDKTPEGAYLAPAVWGGLKFKDSIHTVQPETIKMYWDESYSFVSSTVLDK